MLPTTTPLAEIVELLGRLWLYEVTEATLIAMDAESFRGPYQELGGYVPNTAEQAVVDQLAIEYCKLLVGPKGHLSPVQSVWVDNQFQSRTASSMNRFFELIPGYRPDSNLLDHLGVQLDFLSALLRHSDDESANELVSHFAKTHLQWTSMLFDKIEARNESEFYRGLANVTRNLIDTLASHE